MYLLTIQMCRDTHTYDNLVVDQVVHFSDEINLRKMMARYKSDYVAWLGRGGGKAVEGKGSRVLIQGFAPNAKKGFDFLDEFDLRVDLRKVTIVNPELEEYRATKKASPRFEIHDGFNPVVLNNAPIPAFFFNEVNAQAEVQDD